MCAYFAVLQLEGKVKWEGMWVIFVECIAYGAAYVSPDADFVSIHLTNGNVSSHLVGRGCAAQKHRAAASSTQGCTQGYTQGCSGRSGTWHKRTTSPPRREMKQPRRPPLPPARHHPTLSLPAPSTARAGMWVEWMRYAGWILTCPVLLMTLVSIGVGFEPTLLPTHLLTLP